MPLEVKVRFKYKKMFSFKKQKTVLLKYIEFILYYFITNIIALFGF